MSERRNPPATASELRRVLAHPAGQVLTARVLDEWAAVDQDRIWRAAPALHDALVELATEVGR